jgi:hypothetical protein
VPRYRNPVRQPSQVPLRAAQERRIGEIRIGEMTA